MEYIKIIKTGAYLPEIKIKSEELEKKLKLKTGYIKKRTGIETRYYTKPNETQEEMAKKLVKDMFKENIPQDIGLIITATTTPTMFMPGISNIIQKELNIKTCICLDILAGCAGYINAIDIAQKYMTTSNIQKALIIGVEQLSKFVNPNDIGTVVVLSDGIGGILIERTTTQKKYISNIETIIDNKQMLESGLEISNEEQGDKKKKKTKLSMNGKEIYKYAVTETVKNIQELLNKANENIENIKYIVPHQSNLKIMKSIATRLGKNVIDKMYININETGNTFCASIPIALNQMYKKDLLKQGDKIILIGYGGGLNTGSILIEI